MNFIYDLLVLCNLCLPIPLFIIGLVYLAVMDDETKEERKKSKSYIIGPVLLISSAMLFGLFLYGTKKLSESPWICDKEPYAVEHIVGLADNNLTNGRFYMRRGYIEDKLYYQYMVELGNGGFVANKVNSADATLYYDTSNYRVEWYKKTKQWLYFRNEKTCHKIYIPEGSITDDYTIDLN